LFTDKTKIKIFISTTLSRGYFIETAMMEFYRSQEEGESFAVIMFDLNDFKSINDIYGHAIGDEALRLTSDACKTQLRDCDLFSRYGGDEFIALIPNIDKELTISIGQRVSKAVSALKLGEIELSLSWGMSLNTKEDKALDDVIARADLMMYKMKATHHRSEGSN